MKDSTVFEAKELLILMFNYENNKRFTLCLDNILLQEVNFPFKVIIETNAFSEAHIETAQKYADKYPEIFELQNTIDFEATEGKICYTLYNQYVSHTRHFFQEYFNFKTEPNDITVSISMSAYNQERFIENSLKSILSQETNFKYELIVGEDCSTDGTRRIIERYRRRYPDIIRPIYHEENVGLKINDITIRRRLRGKYRAILEGDDCWLIKDKLQRQVVFLENNPDFIGETGEFITVNTSYAARTRPNPQIYSHEQVFDKVELQKWLMPSNTLCLMHRNIYLNWTEQRLHDYITAKIIGDRKMYLMLLMYGNIYHSNNFYGMRVFRPASKGSWTYLQNQVNIWPTTNEWYINAEIYAKEQFGQKIDLSEKKTEVYVASVKRFLKNPSKQNYKDMKIVYNTAPKKLKKTYKKAARKGVCASVSKCYKGKNLFSGTAKLFGMALKAVKTAFKKGSKKNNAAYKQQINKFC